ncbi:MAG: hypothetical protein ACK559_33690, partial [bacterium]
MLERRGPQRGGAQGRLQQLALLLADALSEQARTRAEGVGRDAQDDVEPRADVVKGDRAVLRQAEVDDHLRQRVHQRREPGLAGAHLR